MEGEILNIAFKKEVSIKAEHIRANIGIRRKFQKGKKVLTLVDVSKVWEFSTKARELSRESINELSIATAIVTGSSMPVILVVKFFIKHNRPQVPIKLFKTREKALEWLMCY